MLRHALLASAALGAMGACAGLAGAADFRAGDTDANETITESANGSSPRPRPAPRRDVRSAAPREVPGRPRALDVEAATPAIGFAPEDFDDVTALELDVTQIAGALGLAVDRNRADDQLLGRVALHVVDDPRVGAPPIVTDPRDPYIRTLREARTPAPVRTRDIGDTPRGVLPSRGLRLDYTRPVTGSLAGAIEVALEPRANVLFGEQVSGVGGGAVVRFGRNLTEPREHQSRWYAFVGADAQALTWSLGGARQNEVLRLEDKQMVGDYQAGVALRVADGDLAFGFVHREVSWNDVSRDEQYVGVSFTRRR